MAYSILERLEAATGPLDVKQLAAILGGTEANIYKQAQKPAPAGIPCYRIGAKVMFDPSVVAYWIRRQNPMMGLARKQAMKESMEPAIEQGAPLLRPRRPLPSAHEMKKHVFASESKLMRVELDTIDGTSEVLTVDGRGLHAFLQVPNQFTYWITLRIRQYKLLMGRDFRRFQDPPQPLGEEFRNGVRMEYILSISAATQLAMIERNDKSMEARNYFLECEGKLAP